MTLYQKSTQYQIIHQSIMAMQYQFYNGNQNEKR